MACPPLAQRCTCLLYVYIVGVQSGSVCNCNMSVDNTSVECADASNSAAAAVTSSLLTDDVTSDGDNVTRADRSSKSHSVQIREPPVSDTCQPTTSTQQTVVWSETKEGPLHRAIPSMPLPLAVIACILNIVLPGTGRHHNIFLLSTVTYLLSV